MTNGHSNANLKCEYPPCRERKQDTKRLCAEHTRLLEFMTFALKYITVSVPAKPTVNVEQLLGFTLQLLPIRMQKHGLSGPDGKPL